MSRIKVKKNKVFFYQARDKRSHAAWFIFKHLHSRVVMLALLLALSLAIITGCTVSDETQSDGLIPGLGDNGLNGLDTGHSSDNPGSTEIGPVTGPEDENQEDPRDTRPADTTTDTAADPAINATQTPGAQLRPEYKPPLPVPDSVRVTAGKISEALLACDFDTVWDLSSDTGLMALIRQAQVLSEADPGDVLLKCDDVLFKLISPGFPDAYEHFSTEFIRVDEGGDGLYILFTLNLYNDYEYPKYEVFTVCGYALTGGYEMFSFPKGRFDDNYSIHLSGQVVDGKYEGILTRETTFRHGGVSVTEEEWSDGANRRNPGGPFPTDGLAGYIRYIAWLPNW